MEANATNEGGVYGTWRFLKNVMGLWILQQCRAIWAAQEEVYEYGDLVEMAKNARPPNGHFAPNDGRFLPPGDHLTLIQTLYREMGKTVPETKGETVRAILESLAKTYQDLLSQLAMLANKKIDAIHVVGGGSQNELLNQLTADFSGIPVISGPVEATVLGNAIVQLITLGEIKDLAEGRTLIARLLFSETISSIKLNKLEAPIKIAKS